MNEVTNALGIFVLLVLALGSSTVSIVAVIRDKYLPASIGFFAGAISSGLISTGNFIDGDATAGTVLLVLAVLLLLFGVAYTAALFRKRTNK